MFFCLFFRGKQHFHCNYQHKERKKKKKIEIFTQKKNLTKKYFFFLPNLNPLFSNFDITLPTNFLRTPSGFTAMNVLF